MRSLFSILVLMSGLAKADCQFEKMPVFEKIERASLFKINSTTNIFLDGSNEEHTVHEGPGWLMEKGQKKCQIKGGIFGDLFINHKKNILMTEEYSGSDSYNQITNLKNCKPIGEKANYSGSASIQGNRLINSPACESTGKETGSCSSGKVFLFSGKNCKLVLDKKASKALTKKELGTELPDLNKSYKVKNPYTPKAQLMEE